MKFVLLSLLNLVFAAWVATASAHSSFKPTRVLHINNLNIAAYESSGHRGPGILLLHGNTSSAQSFSKILSSSYAKKNRVVAIDLPGYGRSSNASAYSAGFFAEVIAEAAQKLGVSKGVLVGWSLGGDLALQASVRMPKLKGIFIFGTAPVGYAPNLPSPFLTPQESYAGAAVNFGFVPNLDSQQINDYVTAFFRPSYSAPQFFIDAGLRADPLTRAAVYMVATGQDVTFQDEVSLVKNLNIPLAVIHAEKDAFVRYEFLNGLAADMPTLWKNKIITVKKSGHALQWEKPEHFIALLNQFVNTL